MTEQILDKIEEIKMFGRILRPYTFPNAPEHIEDQLIDLKTNHITIDGYKIVIYYTVSSYEQHALVNLQIYSLSLPILPFEISYKICKLFIGPNNLSLIEMVKDDKKVYCWSVIEDQDGKRLPCSHPNSKKIEYKNDVITLIDPKLLD